MDSHLKHRLVGALVVISLAVIVSPLLFDFSGGNRIDRTSQVPPRPDDLPGMMQIEAPEPVADAREPEADPFVPQEAMPLNAEPLIEFAEEMSGEAVDAADNESPAAAETAPGEAAAEEEEPPRLADENAPILNDQGLPNAWVIQVGAFSELAKAQAMRDQLVEQEWKAYFTRPQLGQQGLFKVLVGPFVDPEEANSAKQELDEKLGVETWLTRFEP